LVSNTTVVTFENSSVKITDDASLKIVMREGPYKGTLYIGNRQKWIDLYTFYSSSNKFNWTIFWTVLTALLGAIVGGVISEYFKSCKPGLIQRKHSCQL
jgi:hypothetical protein